MASRIYNRYCYVLFYNIKEYFCPIYWHCLWSDEERVSTPFLLSNLQSIFAYLHSISGSAFLRSKCSGYSDFRVPDSLIRWSGSRVSQHISVRRLALTSNTLSRSPTRPRTSPIPQLALHPSTVMTERPRIRMSYIWNGFKLISRWARR